MATQPDTLQGVYLDDSYLLGIAVSERQLRLDVLFALTQDNPAYVLPIPGEQHCYRKGELRWDQVCIVSSRGKPCPLVTIDSDGTLDLGSIWYSRDAGIHHVEADSFDIRFVAGEVEVVLAA